jgi:hypothetical protein
LPFHYPIEIRTQGLGRDQDNRSKYCYLKPTNRGQGRIPYTLSGKSIENKRYTSNSVAAIPAVIVSNIIVLFLCAHEVTNALDSIASVNIGDANYKKCNAQGDEKQIEHSSDK